MKKPLKKLSVNVISLLERLEKRISKLEGKENPSPTNKIPESARPNVSTDAGTPTYIDIDCSNSQSPAVFGMSNTVEDARATLQECNLHEKWRFQCKLHGAYKQTAYATILLIFAKWARNPQQLIDATDKLWKYSLLLAHHGYPLVRWLRTQSHVRLISQYLFNRYSGEAHYDGLMLYVKYDSAAAMTFANEFTLAFNKANQLYSIDSKLKVNRDEIKQHVNEVRYDTGHPPL